MLLKPHVSPTRLLRAAICGSMRRYRLADSDFLLLLVLPFLSSSASPHFYSSSAHLCGCTYESCDSLYSFCLSPHLRTPSSRQKVSARLSRWTETIAMDIFCRGLPQSSSAIDLDACLKPYLQRLGIEIHHLQKLGVR